MRGPQPAELRLSVAEQNELEALVRRHGTPQQLARRARMILAAHEGKRNGQIAREQGASVDTVRKWRMHWIGLDCKRSPWKNSLSANAWPISPVPDGPLRSRTFKSVS
jgi:DNA-binding CsgD family transcriptional regulator